MKTGPNSDRFGKAPDALASAAPQPVGVRLAPQMLMMFRALIASEQWNKILLLGVALFAVIAASLKQHSTWASAARRPEQP
jgi:hypothetical protein